MADFSPNTLEPSGVACDHCIGRSRRRKRPLSTDSGLPASNRPLSLHAPFATFETTPSNDVVGVETGRSLWFAGGSAPNLPFAMLAAAGGFDAKRQFGQAFLLGPHPPARGVRACVSRIRIDCSHLATVGRDEYIERREAYFKRQ
jgi:hypothetical protein